MDNGMNKSYLALIIGVLALSASEFRVPPLTGRVVDQTGTLNREGRKRIEQAILSLEQASGGQMAVAFLNSKKSINQTK